jgi:hypothetical protein
MLVQWVNILIKVVKKYPTRYMIMRTNMEKEKNISEKIETEEINWDDVEEIEINSEYEDLPNDKRL